MSCASSSHRIEDATKWFVVNCIYVGIYSVKMYSYTTHASMYYNVIYAHQIIALATCTI